MRGPFEERILGIPWTALVAGALAMAAVRAIVVPQARPEGRRGVAPRRGHGAAWLLLAPAAALRTRVSPMPAAWAGPVASVGGAVYLAFLAALTTR